MTHTVTNATAAGKAWPSGCPCSLPRSAAAPQVRDKIEQSGRENRWEFSKTALFECTAHVVEVCARLEAMLDTVHNFRHFLGPQLEVMTGSGKARVPSCPLAQPSTLASPAEHKESTGFALVES